MKTRLEALRSIPDLRKTFLLALSFMCVLGLLGCGGGGSDGSGQDSIISPPNLNAPTVDIWSPQDGSIFKQGNTITFGVEAQDTEDGLLFGSSIIWESSLAGQIGTGASLTRNDLSVGMHTITATATDSGGKTASDIVTITILEHHAPSVTISSPADEAVFAQGESISFEGSAYDPDDGALSGGSLVWTLPLEGDVSIGTGASFTLNNLLVGEHTITLTATDNDGKTESSSVTITIVLNQAPSVAISSPANQAVFVQGDSISFEGSASDTEDGPLSGNSLVWTSSLEGSIGTGVSFTRNDFLVGSHTITLTATDNNGKSSSEVRTIIVEAPSGEKTFGGNGDEVAYAIQQTSDGGYIVAGSTDTGGNANYLDFYLVKMKSNGQKEWEKTFGWTDYEEAYAVQQTSDGGYIVGGHSGTASYDFYLVKLDPNGVEQWSEKFGESGYDEIYSLQQTSDGGYILAGYAEEYDIDEGLYRSNLAVIKLDDDHKKVWDITIGEDNYHMEASSIKQTSDGDYIVAGTRADDLDWWYDIYIAKLDGDTGAVAAGWPKIIGGGNDNDEIAEAIQQTSDGGYIVAGSISDENLYFDFYVVKLDSDGQVKWSKTFGGSEDEEAYSVQQTTDGGYIIAGYTDSYGSGGHNFYILKLDKDGVKKWDKTIGGSTDEEANSIQQTADGGYVVAGYVWLESGQSDFYVVKLDSSGNIEPF